MKLRLELFVESIEKSVEFYSNVLEFNVPKETKENYRPVRKGDVVLGLGEMKNLTDHHPLKISGSGQQIGLGVEIVLEVEDVNDVYTKVVAKGYPIQTELTKRPWGMVDFRIIDPDGYYLRITSGN
ncbi:glyoxalase/bleomycin resistance/extradiol dioxygenase family protein [Salipaludibacillus neizhouensis]|uniref:Glyoxalase/bleomycin resistance/extradiol dioxygenase family protein n=1 Tax=Salipaludibacillus neizhouensis TaxID=885475 RepID=A0A3A9JWQ4_9BACI|nr:VOC family protein [Salipaludibacillus neizhouensis]RKL64699.1 glyoxalase/bleomycin resistance/extradiol dioxygenase family protein [Salipaludibacillus neizhouensis]